MSRNSPGDGYAKGRQPRLAAVAPAKYAQVKKLYDTLIKDGTPPHIAGTRVYKLYHELYSQYLDENPIQPQDWLEADREYQSPWPQLVDPDRLHLYAWGFDGYQPINSVSELGMWARDHKEQRVKSDEMLFAIIEDGHRWLEFFGGDLKGLPDSPGTRNAMEKQLRELIEKIDALEQQQAKEASGKPSSGIPDQNEVDEDGIPLRLLDCLTPTGKRIVRALWTAPKRFIAFSKWQSKVWKNAITKESIETAIKRVRRDWAKAGVLDFTLDLETPAEGEWRVRLNRPTPLRGDQKRAHPTNSYRVRCSA